MKITLRSSGSLARLIAASDSVTQTASGSFEGRWSEELTLGELIESLGCTGRPLLCVIDGQSIPVDDRDNRQLSDGMQIALMPPIRAG